MCLVLVRYLEMIEYLEMSLSACIVRNTYNRGISYCGYYKKLNSQPTVFRTTGAIKDAMT